MIVRYMGGLGNQLFQYAFGIACEKQYGVKVEFDKFSYTRDKKRKYELEQFQISNKSMVKGVKSWYYNVLFYFNSKAKDLFVFEKKTFDYQKYDIAEQHKYYIGHWQNVKYFDMVRQELKKEFNLISVPSQISHLYKIINENRHSIAVHVRRGDYLSIHEYVVQTMEYYEAAMHMVRKKITNPVFYVFSDDIDWCKHNFDISQNDIFFIDGNSTVEDFILMRACHGFIISNSTYSWWPAYLSESKVIVAPEKWYIDENENDEVKNALLKSFIII